MDETVAFRITTVGKKYSGGNTPELDIVCALSNQNNDRRVGFVLRSRNGARRKARKHQLTAVFPFSPAPTTASFLRVPRAKRPDTNDKTKVLGLLEPVKAQHPDISFADLIVLAASVSLKRGDASLPTLTYCKGRVDAAEDDPNNGLLSILEPTREYESVIVGVRDRMKIAGLSVSVFFHSFMSHGHL